MQACSKHVALGVAVGAVFLAGCAHDDTPPPPSASIPPVGTYTQLRGEPPKPLPAQEPPLPPPGFVDEPLVTQAAPEVPAFVEAYSRVGSPRIALFMNRTLQGQTIPTNPGGTVAGVEQSRQTSGAVKIEAGSHTTDPWGRPLSDSTSRFETTGPAEIRDKTEVYLAPGQYDEANARRVEYDAIEAIMTDWLAAGGKVTMVSPTLTQSQQMQLQQGDRNVLSELEKQSQIDVLIQVQAKPTRQTAQGLAVRLVAEAINTRGGESIGRAVVDVPPPLDKPQINEYTRFLARKLMSDLAHTWSNPRPQREAAAGTPENPPANPNPGGQPMPLPPTPSTLPTTVPGPVPTVAR
ncbi:MAG: hypothetical protein ACTHM6_05790 [Tepidisphaeraceae bacterium]